MVKAKQLPTKNKFRIDGVFLLALVMTLSFDTEIIKHYMFDHFYLMTLLDSPLFPVSTALVLLV